MNQRMTRAAAGLAALFAATTVASIPGQADALTYNPNPANAAEARAQITYLRDQLAALPARFAGAANDLATTAPTPHGSLQPGEKSCFTLSTSVRLSFDFGAGPVRTPMVRILQAPARDVPGDNAPGHSAAVTVPNLTASYYPDLPAFLRANQAELGNSSYRDVRVPPSLIGCAASPEELRPVQQQANLAFYMALRERVSARIEADYAKLRAVIYNEEQDPVLTHPPRARP